MAYSYDSVKLKSVHYIVKSLQVTPYSVQCTAENEEHQLKKKCAVDIVQYTVKNLQYRTDSILSPLYTPDSFTSSCKYLILYNFSASKLCF